MNLCEIVDQSIRTLYQQIENQLPDLTRITFELSNYTQIGQFKLHGFIHIGSKVKRYNSIGELEQFIGETIAKHNILFKQFD